MLAIAEGGTTRLSSVLVSTGSPGEQRGPALAGQPVRAPETHAFAELLHTARIARSASEVLATSSASVSWALARPASGHST